MVIQIAVAGKGGTGETTFAAPAIRELRQKREKTGKKPVLAVDAEYDLLGRPHNITSLRQKERETWLLQ